MSLHYCQRASFHFHAVDLLAFGLRGNIETLWRTEKEEGEGRGISELHSFSFLVLCGENCFLGSLGRGSKSKCNPSCRAGV